MATPGTECSGEWMLPRERKKGHRNQVWIPAPEGGPRGAAPHPGREPGRSLRLSEERVMRCTFIVGIKNLNQSSRSLARESHEPLSGRITAAQLGGGNGSFLPLFGHCLARPWWLRYEARTGWPMRGNMQSPWHFLGSVPENYERYLVPRIFAPWAEDLVETAALRTGERVLDIGCAPE